MQTVSIIYGLQDLPSPKTGMVNLARQDALDVVFARYPNDNAAGYTMAYLVVGFNPEDSAGTALLRTGRIVGPVTTNTIESNNAPGFTLIRVRIADRSLWIRGQGHGRSQRNLLLNGETDAGTACRRSRIDVARARVARRRIH